MKACTHIVVDNRITYNNDKNAQIVKNPQPKQEQAKMI